MFYRGVSSVGEAVDLLVDVNVAAQSSRIAELGGNATDVVLMMLDSNMKTIESILARVPQYAPMTPELAKELIAQYWTKYAAGMCEQLGLVHPDLLYDGEWPIQTWDVTIRPEEN